MAGKIPQSFIDDLLARINVLDIVESRVKLKRTGKNYSGLCPFHKEKSPSFTVNNEKQFYYCFGCGAGGNALGFIMEHDRLSFPEAVEELAKLAGVEVPRDESRVDHQRELRRKDIFALLEEASDFYQEQLKQHSQKAKAVDYLKGRGLTGKIAALFGIGYAPPGWDNLLKKLTQSDADKPRLEQAGMLIHKEESDRYYDRFRDRIMFPIRDMRGRVIAFGGRVLGDEKPKYLNSPETETFHKSRELYGLYEARKFNQNLTKLIIVEGYMDVVGLAQYGISYAVATLGTATTAQHLERIFKMVDEVIFCFDGDQAGRKAASRALETTLPVIKDGKQARFLFLPEGEDPDSLVRQEGTENFEQRLQEALPLSDFFFRTLGEDADLNSLDGRASFSNQALPMIQLMQPSILQQMMQEKISELTGLSFEQLNSITNLQEATRAPQQPAAHSYEHEPAMQYDDYPQPEYDQGGSYYDNDYSGYSNDQQHSGNDFSPKSKGRGNKGKGKFKNKNFRQDKQEFRPPQDLNIRITPASSAISILLHAPHLANGCELDFLAKSKNQTELLLYRLVEYLRLTPDATLGMLFVDWESDSELAGYLHTLNEISHLEPIQNTDSAQNVLSDSLQRLQERSIDQQIDELKSLKQRSAEDNQRLNQLLMQQHSSRSGR
ncbi:DNA primase [Aliamphritea spongicola]|uniref:DNA primase n=1 Tax=Aliamphritea spongicola TaxID=707589 RepID=UPI00196AB094|nr:DNA primase [Aliamphritea spongicola]MBN3563746.1 DNA primase [Aliamphritea spongicola]